MNSWNLGNRENYTLQSYLPPSLDFMSSNFNHNGQGLGTMFCFPFLIQLPELYEIQKDFNQRQTLNLNQCYEKVKVAHLEKKLESQACCVKATKIQKKDGNTKANIIRDFINSIKKDASAALLAKKSLKVDYPLKKFMELVLKNFPSEEKYFRFKKLIEICKNHEDAEFSHLLRTMLYNFLRGEYQLKILLKKKSKTEYLSACRQMIQKLVQNQ